MKKSQNKLVEEKSLKTLEEHNKEIEERAMVDSPNFIGAGVLCICGKEFFYNPTTRLHHNSETDLNYKSVMCSCGNHGHKALDANEKELFQD